MGVSIPSEQEYAEQGGGDFPDRKLFPADDYIFEVSQITEQPGKVDIFYKPSKPGDPETRTYTGLELRLRPVTFANGDELQDEDGDDAQEGALLFDWLDPSKVGLKPQPSKARKFFAATLGLEIEDRIDIEQWSELIGKRIIGTVIIKANAVGKRNNRVVSYRKVRTRRGSAATPATSAPSTKVEPAGPLPNQVEADAFSDLGDDLPF